MVLVEGLQARILGFSAELVSEEGEEEEEEEEEASGELFWVVDVVDTEGLVRVSVTITVDPACCSGAVGVMLTIDVTMWVVGSGTGAVVVMVSVAYSDSGVGESRLVNRAEASAAARARVRRVE